MNKCKKIIIPILIIAMFFCIIPKTENAAENKRKIGDINGDGIINSIDTLRILEHIAASTISKIKQKRPEWILKNEKFKAGDINGDGVIDSIDTLRELEYIAASTVPKIAQKNPNWKKYIESKWTIEATGITLNSTNITIEKGKTSKLVATVKPTNASNKIVTWSSSDKKVATVDGIGNVTGKANGVTIVTAKLSNGLSKTCKVTVKETNKTPTKQVPTTPTPTKQKPTTSKTTTPTSTKQEPTTSTPTKLTVKIKNISSVSAKLSKTSLTYNGKVQTPAVILKDGKTKLTKGKDYLVSYANNKNVGTATVIITGKGKYTGKVTKTFKINKATYNTKNLKFANATVIYDGNKHSIKATGIPAGVKVTYTGNEKTSVGTYKITAKFVGDSKNYNTIKERKATLKIKAKSISKVSITGIENKSYTRKAITQNIIIKDGNRILKNGTDYTVKYENNIKIGNNAKVVITGKGNYIGTVTKTFSINAVKVTKLIASAPMWRQIEKGKFGQLRAKVSPDNATNKTITWTSSNPKVVKVNKSGTIHVVGHGIAKITAKHKESGLSVTYTIVGYTPAKSISLNKSSLKLNEGKTEKLTVSFNPTTTSSKEVNWTSSNPNIVSVSSAKTTNGSVTISAKAKGTAIITATSKYGPKATCIISVVEKQTINIQHAINVSSRPHAKAHEHLPWHGGTVGGHAGMIGAYVEAINILNETDYSLLEIYNKIISAHPEQKHKNKAVYENTDINDYYNISVSRASANINEVKKALSQGKVVADIANTTNWRNGSGNLWGKTGQHTGLIFYFDGKYYHMKTSVQLNALYTESQLIDWLKDTGAKLIIYSKK